VQADYFQPPFRDYSSWNRDRGPELAELDMITERKKNWSSKRAQGKTEFSALLEVRSTEVKISPAISLCSKIFEENISMMFLP